MHLNNIAREATLQRCVVIIGFWLLLRRRPRLVAPLAKLQRRLLTGEFSPDLAAQATAFILTALA